MRDFSHRAKLFTIFRGYSTILRVVSTIFRVGRLRLLRSAQGLLT